MARPPASPRCALALAAALAACAAAPPAPRRVAASTAGPGDGVAPSPGAACARGTYGPDPAPTLTQVEQEVAAAARANLSGAGAHLQLSGSLTAAARLLARSAAGRTSGASGDALARTAVRDALTDACAFDPAATPFLVVGSPSLLRQAVGDAVRGTAATHLGVGVVGAAGGATLAAVVVTSERRARLDPFPREVAPGSSAVLSGELRGGLHRPRVFLTGPSGDARENESSGTGPFRSSIRFPEPGRYVVEVVGEGLGGPSVAALLVVSAGGGSLRGPPEPETADPADPGQAEARVVAELSALRARHGLGPVVASPELTQVARRHSAAMKAAQTVAHVLPGSPGPGERLDRAGIPYWKVFENVAMAPSALAAHRTAEESPAHLENMLQPEVTQVGVGIARDVGPAGDARVYLTELLVKPVEDRDGDRLTLDARVREAIWKERARLHLAPLTQDAALDELARDGARELQRRDARELPDLAPEALALHRSLAGGDGFVASAPAEVIQSRNLRDPRFRRVGVGVVEGSSRRFGARRLFIAVVYTD